MNMVKRKMISIVTEGAIEESVLKDLTRLGAGGYTVWDARGSGSRGERGGDWDQNRNVLIQVICSSEMTETILSDIQARYYRDYAMVAYVSDVEVYRAEKFL